MLERATVRRRVVRYDPKGKIERRIKLPVQQVSSVAFGGENLTDLYITTAGQAWRVRRAARI